MTKLTSDIRYFTRAKESKIKKSQKRLTIYDIKRITAETEPHFFSPEWMRVFKQKLSDFKVTKRKDGKYDVIAPSYWTIKGKKQLMGHTYRIYNPETNKLEYAEYKEK